MSEVIICVREVGVDRMFVVGFNKLIIECVMKLIDEYDFLYGIIGWYLVDVIDFIEEYLEWIEFLV